jgi:hypothetical protein
VIFERIPHLLHSFGGYSFATKFRAIDGAMKHFPKFLKLFIIITLAACVNARGLSSVARFSCEMASLGGFFQLYFVLSQA